MPIVQQFIKKYQEESGGENIAQLGEFAAALSRGEVDAESVDNVTGTYSLGQDPEGQDKWGDINATDSDESDSPNWGFLNLKKLGHIALGIAKEELHDLPIRGIEDAIDVLGREKDWD
ncbi:hypothetical protein OS493_017158 [Desmophyllum pertusum]|uniref:Uncharacterized protein n=1 Tax=Desmophyllum pertusum TaxID=174260 RepID=A0A9W9YCK5_9CNID|nr:hypothetical protein OS493_017158 [Desmophyllum pertusum]